MSTTLLIVSVLYAAALVYSAFRGKKTSEGKSEQFLLAGSKVGFVLGFLTFSATLFSAFTLMGMPDFFRRHGAGAWIFLGVSDAAMAFVILWFGLAIRRSLGDGKFVGVSDLIFRRSGSRALSLIYPLGVFVFLLPYVVVQIRGVAIFLQAVVPGNLSVGVWILIIMTIMFLYSAFGGLKAIIYSDAIQGVTLLIVTWIIAFVCLKNVGGVESLFHKTGELEADLLSIPGPSGIFTFQFLLVSFMAIAIMPMTQPQLIVRLAIMKSGRDLRNMSAAFGIFAMGAILPTVVIGLYGSLKYPSLSPGDFIAKVAVGEQTTLVASLAIVGLIAAAMSTADSILFALGNEVQTLFPGAPEKAVFRSKAAILIFSIIAAALSMVSSDQLALLGMLSITGTAMLAPMVSTAVYSNSSNVKKASLISAALLTTLILSLIGALPQSVFNVRIDLLLLIISIVSSFCLSFLGKTADNRR